MKHTVAFYSDVDKIEPWTSLLRKKGIDLVPWPSQKHNFKNIKYVIVWNPPKHMWKDFPNLKLIQSLGAGVDHILKSEPPRHINICKLIDPDLTEQMVHYALLAILMCHRNIHKNIIMQKRKTWKQFNHKSTSSTTVLILGFGIIGKEIAKSLLNLKFRVQAWKLTSITELENYSNIKVFIGDKQLNAALKNSDIIISTLPSTKKTLNLFNFKKFTKFKNNSYFINIGRGNTIIENDLINALNKNILEGVILDVFENEPLNSNSSLWQHPKVFITPHVAGLTKPNLNNAKNFLKNLLSINNKSQPVGLIDRDKGY